MVTSQDRGELKAARVRYGTPCVRTSDSVCTVGVFEVRLSGCRLKYVGRDRSAAAEPELLAGCHGSYLAAAGKSMQLVSPSVEPGVMKSALEMSHL